MDNSEQSRETEKVVVDIGTQMQEPWEGQRSSVGPSGAKKRGHKFRSIPLWMTVPEKYSGITDQRLGVFFLPLDLDPSHPRDRAVLRRPDLWVGDVRRIEISHADAGRGRDHEQGIGHLWASQQVLRGRSFLPVLFGRRTFTVSFRPWISG